MTVASELSSHNSGNSLLTASFPLFAPAPSGLESLVGQELAALGITARPVEGGSAWEGGWDDLIRTHLHLRIASRVLVRFGHFRARALGELERKAAALPWTRFVRGPVRFRISAGRSRIYHERAAEERLRRVLGEAGLDQPAPGPDDDAALIIVRIFQDEVTVSADASGEHLHRRGYRLDPGMAPLRETLAAAALRITRWGAEPLVDPFAGSGTIPIEAALLALNVPPGLARADRAPRHFAFLDWDGAPREAFAAAVETARAAIRADAPPIFASDRDARAVAALQDNAARAGVTSHITIANAPLGEAPMPDHGMLLTNPPYGSRLGERRRLRSLYRSLGRRIRESGLRAAFFEADRILAIETGLELHEAFATRNGGIRVRLAVAGGPTSEDDDAAPAET